MTLSYTRLPARNVDKSAGLLRPVCILPELVKLDDPALHVMTDFHRLTAFFARPGDTIKHAEEHMIRRKVRLLFAMDSDDRMVGLVTLTDIHSEKPMQVVQSRGIRRDEVLVADIMTPVERLEAVDYDDIANARVGHVLETLKARGRQHALVIEHTEGRQMVRGMLSMSQLCKQLGINVETTEVANTFIEIGQHLAHA